MKQTKAHLQAVVDRQKQEISSYQTILNNLKVLEVTIELKTIGTKCLRHGLTMSRTFSFYSDLSVSSFVEVLNRTLLDVVRVEGTDFTKQEIITAVRDNACYIAFPSRDVLDRMEDSFSVITSSSASRVVEGSDGVDRRTLVDTVRTTVTKFKVHS